MQTIPKPVRAAAIPKASRLVGVLTRNDFIAGLARHGPERRVGDVTRREFVTASRRDMLQTAVACRVLVPPGRTTGGTRWRRPRGEP
jgi:predicted transcriptional regulator